MDSELDELIEDTGEQLEDLLSTVNRRTNVFRGYARDDIDEERYLEELERTGEVTEELEDVEERIEYAVEVLYSDDREVDLEDLEDVEEYRGEVMKMKGMYDGLLNRLKEAGHTAARIEREHGRDFEPAYKGAGDRADS